MLDIKFIRENPGLIRKALNQRGTKVSLDQVLKLDKERRDLLTESDNLKHQRNTVSQKIARLKKEKKDSQELIRKMRQVSQKIKEIDEKLKSLEDNLNKLLLYLPNIPHPSVPEGRGPKGNQVVREIGKKKKYDFPLRPHWEIAETLGILDIPLATRMSGTRFALYQGKGALLERALINFMLDLQTKNGYTELIPPYLVNSRSMTATGQLPRFAVELYKCADDDLYLIPTAEVPLTNIYQGQVLQEEKLPYRYVAYTPCFRREAGTWGKDTRGLIRQHQFNKIELVKFCRPKDSWDELEKLTSDAEQVLQQLDLSYRVVTLCTADLGFAAAKTYDLEVWMSGEARFLEISSCGNFTDFQARRANIRYRSKDKKTLGFVHTLNGSALAVGRTFAAILENYQQPDGSVVIPEVLRPYMHNLERIQ